MTDATFTTFVLCVQAGITAGVWLFIQRAVQEMERCVAAEEMVAWEMWKYGCGGSDERRN
jgi:hypothetical protein